jgi:hypothetical protein
MHPTQSYLFLAVLSLITVLVGVAEVLGFCFDGGVVGGVAVAGGGVEDDEDEDDEDDDDDDDDDGVDDGVDDDDDDEDDDGGRFGLIDLTCFRSAVSSFCILSRSASIAATL